MRKEPVLWSDLRVGDVVYTKLSSRYAAFLLLEKGKLGATWLKVLSVEPGGAHAEVTSGGLCDETPIPLSWYGFFLVEGNDEDQRRQGG